ncbi:zinc ribbon domain-containing protein [Candidatus Poribacteria bacterium]|nr:zinc ribbon domain-containing protein [Candidatus Poribacteria bacterium]
MPTYEYRCDACGAAFERFQSITAEPVRDCPSCQTAGRVRRLISGGAGLIFRGSGFYITDYRSESYRQAAKSDSSSSDSAKASSTSSDSSSSPKASS